MLVRMLPLSLALLLVGCANATAPPSPNGPPATGGSLPIGSRPAPATALALPLSQNDASPPGVVSLVNVTSDRVADVSSLEAWQRSFIQDGMSDADKAQAIWRSVVAFRHQAEPPRELIEYASHPHDPIRMFNVYGYAQCDCATAAVSALGRAVGLGARGRSLTAHTVPELFYGGAWHLLDGSLINWFPQPSGTLASVDEIAAATSSWLAQHPGLAGNRAALLAYMVNPGWRSGPPLLAASPYYSDNGRFPAGVQGWADTMLEYPGGGVIYEDGYTLGYRVNVQLRQGERLVRNWFNNGHHVNEDLGLACDPLTAVPGQGDLRYSPAYGDIAPGRVGNGTHTYELPIDGNWRAGVLAADNLADGMPGCGPRVHAADRTRPGVLVVRMPSSYVDLAGTLTVAAQVASGGAITVSFSRNHGVDWTPIATISASGRAVIDLSPWVRRQYDYRLRIELAGFGTGFDALSIEDVVQHSQRALPALAAGDNQIHLGAGPDEGTITLEANSDASQTANRTYTEYHPTLEGLVDGVLQPSGGKGAVTFPVETPGDLKRLRFGTFYRARGSGDRWDYLVSFDRGATWVAVDSAVGPTPGAERFVTFDRIPPKTRQVLVRFSGTQVNTLRIFDFRIDADYAEPTGAFTPLEIRYDWTENGQARSDVHVATTADERYVIHCNAPPVMRSLIVSRANGR